MRLCCLSRPSFALSLSIAFFIMAWLKNHSLICITFNNHYWFIWCAMQSTYKLLLLMENTLRHITLHTSFQCTIWCTLVWKRSNKIPCSISSLKHHSKWESKEWRKKTITHTQTHSARKGGNRVSNCNRWASICLSMNSYRNLMLGFPSSGLKRNKNQFHLLQYSI